MKPKYPVLGALSLAACLTTGLLSSASAAPPMSKPAAMPGELTLLTPVHSRRYHHCHRYCTWRYGRRVCRTVCHRW